MKGKLAVPEPIAKIDYNDLFEPVKEKPRKHILVVDDDGNILRLMKRILETDYSVGIANSGDSALKAIDRKRPDVVLLDYEMPKCNGKQTLEIIRRTPGLSDLPVFFLSGVSDVNKVREVLELKPQGYILKTIGKEELLDKLEEFFKSNH